MPQDNERERRTILNALAESVAYDARILSMGKRASPLPQSSGKRRELLTTVFAMKPDLRGVLTAAGREFHALTDEDVDLLLKQLQDLGVLDDLPSQQG